MITDKLDKERVMQANIELHSKLAKVYKKEEPQYRKENVDRVKAKLTYLAKKTRAKQLLDVGCGSGFIIDIARKLPLRQICGVDITKPMMDEITLKGKVPLELKMADITEAIPFEAGRFEMATAYSVLSHLYAFETLFKEVHRCLRPGGVFYTDLDPNYYFWNSLEALPAGASYPPFIAREIQKTIHNDTVLAKKFGVDKTVYNTAEYQKTKRGGMKEEDIRQLFLDAGFKKVDCAYHWFLGAAVINNDPKISKRQRATLLSTVDTYLQSALPMSRSLYKYISFRAWK